MKKIFTLILSFFLLLLAIPAHAIVPKPSTINLTILFKNQLIPANIKTKLIANNAKIVSEFPELGGMQVRGSADLITLLQMDPSIQSVSPTIVHTLEKTEVVKYDEAKQLKPLLDKQKNNPNFGGGTRPIPPSFPLLHQFFQWDIKRVTHFDQSYQTETGNHNVVVGIIDTGVDKDHPDLVKNLLGGRNFVPPGGFDGSDQTEHGDPNDFQDRNGHGTHVAGTIAGNGQILGVAPNIGFKAYRVFGADGSAQTTSIVNAILGATKDKVDVISMSLGGYDVTGQTWWTDPNTGKAYNLGNDVADIKLYKRAIQYAAAHGVTVVAAAGNDNIDVTNKREVNEFLNKQLGAQGYKIVGGAIEVPGSLPGVITVGATGPDDLKASYSNRGAGFIDVSAPGGDGERFPSGLWYEDMNFSSDIDNWYTFMEGTSMATPKVSAVAALIIAHEGKIGPQKVAQRIKETAEDLGISGSDNLYGAGMVQAPRNEQKDTMVNWQKSFGGLENDGAIRSVQSRDGGYLTFGGTESYLKDEDAKLYLIKTYDNGRVEWRKVFGESGQDWPMDFKPTNDGGSIALTYNVNVTDKVYRTVNVYKLDSKGVIQWKSTFGGAGSTLVGRSIAVTNDGYVVAGDKDHDAELIKLDLNGKKIFENKYDYQQSNESASVVKTTPDGGYIVAGNSNSTVEYTHQKDYFYFKVKDNGMLEWQKVYGKADLINETVNDIVPTKDGGYMVIGSESHPISEGYNLFYLPSIYYGKIDAKGNPIWEKTIGEISKYEEALTLKATSDGNYIFAGTQEKANKDKDIFVLKFNEKGDTLLSKTFGGSCDDYASDINQTVDGGYIIAGNTQSFVNGFQSSFGYPGDRDMYVLKLNKQ